MPTANSEISKAEPCNNYDTPSMWINSNFTPMSSISRAS